MTSVAPRKEMMMASSDIGVGVGVRARRVRGVHSGSVGPGLLPVKEISEWAGRGFEEIIKAAKREELLGRKAHARQLRAYGYTRRDGFLPFMRDVVGTDILCPSFHGVMVDAVVGALGRYTLNLAFRGSLKSSIFSVAATGWNLARDVIENRGDSTMSIGLASERKQLARMHLRAVKGLMQSDAYVGLWGEGKPRGWGSRWREDEFTSGLRSSEAFSRNKNPSCFVISLGAEQTGYHADRIVADDLQAFASSFTADQLDKCWELYVLLGAILNPGGTMAVVGTRWSFSDIYARIISQAKENPGLEPFVITEQPIVDTEGKPVYTPRFSQAVIDSLREKNTPFSWASQYMLNPVSDDTRKFDLRDLRYMSTRVRDYISNRKLTGVMGVDPNWVSQERKRSGESESRAHTVIVRFVVDGAHNLYMTHYYRGRPTKNELCQLIWDQYYSDDLAKTAVIGIQQVDLKYLSETLESHCDPHGRGMPLFEAVHDARGTRKVDRIEGALEGLVRVHKLFLLPGHPEMENEFYQFPYSKTFDALDAITAASKVVRKPAGSIEHEAQKPRSGEGDRHIDRIENSSAGRRRSWKLVY